MTEVTNAVTLIARTRMLFASKLDAFWRLMTSSMRGCCHWPGVERAGEGCCCCCFCGVRLWSLGRMDATAVNGEEGVAADCWREVAGVGLL